MKLKVQFELDLTGTSYNIKGIKDISASIQELSCLLNQWHQGQLSRRVNFLAHENPAVRKALAKHAEEQASITEQVFNNFKVSGHTQDGVPFYFSHEEPGYKELTLTGSDAIDSLLR